jgi:hypothetical protein
MPHSLGPSAQSGILRPFRADAALPIIRKSSSILYRTLKKKCGQKARTRTNKISFAQKPGVWCLCARAKASQAAKHLILFSFYGGSGVCVFFVCASRFSLFCVFLHSPFNAVPFGV